MRVRERLVVPGTRMAVELRSSAEQAAGGATLGQELFGRSGPRGRNRHVELHRVVPSLRAEMDVTAVLDETLPGRDRVAEAWRRCSAW